jgi:hypothetical protein
VAEQLLASQGLSSMEFISSAIKRSEVCEEKQLSCQCNLTTNVTVKEKYTLTIDGI